MTQITAALGPRPRPIVFQQGDKMTPVCDKRQGLADTIDTNHDGVLSDDELKQYMRKHDILKAPSPGVSVNEKAVMDQFKAYLSDTKPGKRDPSDPQYHTYQQAADELKAMADQHPDICQLVSLGKTYEGRDIWAVKISGNVQGDTSAKPGVTFDGGIHAREWMPQEAMLGLAHKLVDGYATDPQIKKDVDGAEIWVVPCANPDGYEYSRTQDSMWRKNRQPIDNSACSTGGGSGAVHTTQTSGPNVTIGVDCNRNFDDGDPNHEVLYRPNSDKPCRTDDDFGETSDDPDSDVYRGPSGNSEAETQALLKLELKPNMQGVIAHHSYGNDILRPWGHTAGDPDRLAEYNDLGDAMTKAMDQPYSLIASVSMYPTAGDSTDCLHGAGLTALTIEMGDSFQPDASQIPSMSGNVDKADMAFLEWIIQHKTGTTRQPLASIPPFENGMRLAAAH